MTLNTSKEPTTGLCRPGNGETSFFSFLPVCSTNIFHIQYYSLSLYSTSTSLPQPRSYDAILMLAPSRVSIFFHSSTGRRFSAENTPFLLSMIPNDPIFCPSPTPGKKETRRTVSFYYASPPSSPLLLVE